MSSLLSYSGLTSYTQKLKSVFASRSDLENRPEIFDIQGNTSGTAGTWTGSCAGISAYTDGMLLLFRIGVAGATTTTLNINGLGAKTVYRYGTSKLTTHYAVGSRILLQYSTDLNGGCFIGVAEYDANSYAYVRAYSYETNTSYNKEYALLARQVQTAVTANSYGNNYSQFATDVTLNPYKGTVTASGGFIGTATRATADADGNNIASTYATKSEFSLTLPERCTATIESETTSERVWSDGIVELKG